MNKSFDREKLNNSLDSMIKYWLSDESPDKDMIIEIFAGKINVQLKE